MLGYLFTDPIGRFLIEYNAGVKSALKRGAQYGALGGFAFSSFTYLAGAMGACGPTLQRQMQATNPFLFIAGGTLAGSALGGGFGAVGALGPSGALVSGMLGVGLGSVGYVGAFRDMIINGVNPCNGAQFALSAIGIGFGRVILPEVRQVGGNEARERSGDRASSCD